MISRRASIGSRGSPSTSTARPRRSPGTHAWRYRGVDRQGKRTGWSQVRRFTIPADRRGHADAAARELLTRSPKSHPRLFVRPEDLPRPAQVGPGIDARAVPESRCGLPCWPRLRRRPSRPKYPRHFLRPTRTGVWWSNREYTIRLRSTGPPPSVSRAGGEGIWRAGQAILLQCASRWDPTGDTGYRYNDEAGMPYNSRFARACVCLRPPE